MTSRAELPKAYDHTNVEGPIYRRWLEKGYFTPRPQPGKKPFVIIMPPPNVTGELHLGHALTATIQDIMARWRRMLGDVTLWLPGSDHAGIATQVVVERQLAREGLTRQQLGREKFEERVWQWVRKYGSTIDEQHKRLGASCDWTRKRFTLDPGPSRAVRTTFGNLYRKGLIYRGERITNWCPRCATALSDLEVEHKELEGALYYIRYPLAEGDDHIEVATTRPETMLGDTAVAVSPRDTRYTALVGKKAILPIMDRPIPIVADEAIDPQFGTGALKVTPGHDPTDYEIGLRHGLDVVTVIGLDGRMTQAAGGYAGVERFACRRAVVAQLEREGYLDRTEPYRHAVGHCQRCGSVVEPLLSRQWFVRIQPLAEPAIRAMTEGRIRIVPERFVGVYLNWMVNIRDWCISRQLWWGHRIPVWYCGDCGKETVAVEDPSDCTHCGGAKLAQDPDVLDTWFSSGLWTHSTLGWGWEPKNIAPEHRGDLDYFYPTSVMETAYEILFFWVARMIMMGLENMGREPFHTVYLHGLVRDPHGMKMSKTRGNVVDPLQLIDHYGTDALRFGLLQGSSAGTDSRLRETKVEAGRNFVNKLWNASRFVLSNLGGAQDLDGWHDLPGLSHREDRWIVSRLSRVAQQVNGYLAAFQFGEAQQAIYEFLWGELCDWYIEMAKVRLRAGDRAPLRVLAHVLEHTLRLLHPFTPFVTEELWQNLLARLPNEGGLPESIVIAPYPKGDASRYDPQAEAELDQVVRVVRAIRNARAQLRIEPARPIAAALEAPPDVADALRGEAEAVRTLARVEPLTISTDAGTSSAENTVTIVAGKAVVHLPLAGVVDVAAERSRLSAERAECAAALERVEALLAKPDFASRAPEEVVERERERLDGLRKRHARLEEILAQLGE